MRWILLLLSAGLLWAASVRLFLKDGTYQAVREYQLLGDRVKYFSIERSEWEEIPVELVDLKKTESTVKAQAEELKAESKIEKEEDEAERAVRKEIRQLPKEAGLYYVQDGQPIRALEAAELKVVNNKRRNTLAKLSPIPMVSGKAQLEMDGSAAKFIVHEEKPEFYFRLDKEERFGLVRCWPGGKTVSRIVEKWEILPVIKEIAAERQEVEIFRRQVSEGLYKVWPTEPLPPGQYAWVEFTEGKNNTQAWDFAYEKQK